MNADKEEAEWLRGGLVLYSCWITVLAGIQLGLGMTGRSRITGEGNRPLNSSKRIPVGTGKSLTTNSRTDTI